MQLYFKKIEENETDGQIQIIIIKTNSIEDAKKLKEKYKNTFTGKTTLITNNHKEKKPCTEVHI